MKDSFLSALLQAQKNRAAAPEESLLDDAAMEAAAAEMAAGAEEGDPTNPGLRYKDGRSMSSTGRVARAPMKPLRPEELFDFVDSSKGGKSGKYPRKHVEGLVRAAQLTGADPYQAIALALQETSLGMHNKGRVNDFAQVKDFDDKQLDELYRLQQSSELPGKYLRLAIALRDKLKYARSLGKKDEASQLQAYNGYGIVTKDSFGGASRAYGVEIGNGLDMGKNPLYGKRLLQLKNDLMRNPYVRSVVEQYFKRK